MAHGEQYRRQAMAPYDRQIGHLLTVPAIEEAGKSDVAESRRVIAVPE
jgi:hypothetical protein